MRWRAATLLSLAMACQQARAQDAAPGRHEAAVAPPPTAARADAPGWTAAFRLRHRPTQGHALPDAVVHAPPNFDARAPLHLVVFFHGIYSRAAWWLVSGDLAPVTGERGVGWGLSTRHDRARVNALVIVPQLAPAGGAFAGAFTRGGFFRDFLDELLREALAERLGGARSVDDIASLTLVGASAGGPVIARLLGGELSSKVRNVVVIDGLYGGESSFAGWHRGSTADAPRRFVNVDAGSRFTRPHAVALARAMRGHRGGVVVQPREGLREAVRDHGAVFLTVPCQHVGMLFAVYDKIVPSLGLPPRGRGASEAPRQPRAPVDPVGALTLGALARGAFARGDARLRDWTWYDDYTLDLAAGQRVRVDARGGRTRSQLCTRHDVEVRVLDGDAELARADDGGGLFDARVELRAPREGRYTVRVMEHDPWAVEGEYSVRATTVE